LGTVDDILNTGLAARMRSIQSQLPDSAYNRSIVMPARI